LNWGCWDRFGGARQVNGILSQFINLVARSSSLLARQFALGPSARMWPTRNKDFAALGFAWDVRQRKDMVRGGFGISYDRIFDNVWSNGT
jgi:hypothetical protein